MERGPVTRGIALGAVLTVAAVILATASALRHRSETRRVTTPDATAPAERRIRVEVINATAVRGLARRATRRLRDLGFDVVDLGTATLQLDSTLVLDRSGHPDWARRVADALGGARVEARPDSSRYLDVTVLLGRSWRAPSEPFNP